MSKKVLWFDEISKKDADRVGGKNASLGEMYSNLTEKGVRIPNGFAVTASAYREHLKSAEIKGDIKDLLMELDINDIGQLKTAGKKIRKMIYKADLPESIQKDIKQSFSKLEEKTEGKLSVAVRSSATAEDLPEASFAGQLDSFLNISEEKHLLRAVKKSMASLFTDRAISYRENKGFDHMGIACSVGIQEMVNAEEGAAGVMFTLDTESGFDGVTLINSSYGFGEYVVKGEINPDQFYVFKEGLKQGKPAIISRECGNKSKKLIKGKNRDTKQKRVKKTQRERFSIEDEDVLQLAEWGSLIEDHYGQPQDIEWAKDGETGELYILQSRPETVESQKRNNIVENYELKKRGKVLLTGTSVGTAVGTGEVKVLDSVDKEENFEQGDVLVTEKTDPDWEPLMEKASAVITDKGGKTSHAAIVSRELGVPTIVGTRKATKRLESESEVTVDCTQGEKGFIYRGKMPYEVHRQDLGNQVETATDIKVNVSNPDHAFKLQKYPNDGVGLARSEFIFNDSVKIHPLAAVNFDDLENKSIKKEIEELTTRYEDKEQYCIDKLAEGLGKIAAAFYPKQTIVRLSDFKSNEYRKLLGGEEFEPKEENPMLGWRGASRYYSEKYRPAFKLECKAIKKAREEWGLDNITVMLPFCRTPEEGRKVLDIMSDFGLEREQDGLDVYVMCELPSNVVLADRFARLFDGVSIGSNDLTQLILGVDRDSEQVNEVYDENNEAVKKMIKDVIKSAHKYEKPVGICGQAPSDSLEFTEFLVREGIDSISLNPDSLNKTKKHVSDMENTIGNTGDKTNSKLLLLLLALGLISAMVILLGAGCNTNLTRNSIDKGEVNADYNPATVRKKVQKKVKKQQQKKIKQKLLPISISTFADFDMKYPFGWQVNQYEDRVELTDPNSDKYITISSTTTLESLQEFKDKVGSAEEIQVSNRQGFSFIELDSTSTAETSTSSQMQDSNLNKKQYITNIRINTSTEEGLYEEITLTKFLKIASNDKKEAERVIETIKFKE